MTNQELLVAFRGFKEFGFPVKFVARDNSVFVYLTIPEGTLQLEFPAEAIQDDFPTEDIGDVTEAVRQALEVMGAEYDPLAAIMEDAYESLYYHKHGKHKWADDDEEA